MTVLLRPISCTNSIIIIIIITVFLQCNAFNVLVALQFMALSLTTVENCYAVPNISARGYECRTNLPPTCAMRGAGIPQGVFIAEHWIQAVADFLNVPAVKVSRSNTEL